MHKCMMPTLHTQICSTELANSMLNWELLDCEDVRSFQRWFDQHEPFDLDEHRLHSLSSGLTATDGGGINCDKNEEVGMKLQKQLDNISIT